jgi:multidrug efflux pump subunit AcrA (membrane-fusion protein)
MAPTPLYRPEVIEAKRNRWLGRLILRQPVSHWVLTWCSIALVGVAIVFVSIGEYAQKVRVDGQLVADPGLIEIAAPAAGTLVSLHYREGDRVDRNAVVAEVRVAQSGQTVRTLQLRASRAGQLSAQYAHPGAHIAAGQPLFALMPEDAVLQAELYLPDHLLASSAVGSEVLLRYRAFPYQHYGQYRGRIARIASSPLAASPADATKRTAAGEDPLYRAVVAIDRQNVRDDLGQIHPLRPGLRLQADIVLEKRRLYEWLLQPFARLRSRTAG